MYFLYKPSFNSLHLVWTKDKYFLKQVKFSLMFQMSYDRYQSKIPNSSVHNCPFAFVVTQVPFMNFYDYFTHSSLCVFFKCFELTNFCVEIVRTCRRRQGIQQRKLHVINLNWDRNFIISCEKHGKHTYYQTWWYMKMTSCMKKKENI